MANLCSSRITFYSDNKDSVCSLKQKLEAIQCENLSRKNEFDSVELECFVNKFYPSIDSQYVNCRGVLTDIEGELKQYGVFYGFHIYTQMAWSAKIGIWHKILSDFYPDVRMAYIAEESSCDYFVMWDADNLFDFHDYYFDICCPTKDGEVQYSDDHEFMTLAGIWDWLDKNLPFDYTKTEDVSALEQEIWEKLEAYDNDEFYCTIARYERIAPSEFEFLRTQGRISL